MEKIIVLTIVFISIGLLIRRMVKIFKGKDPCGMCKNRKKCIRGNNCSLFYLGKQKERENKL